MNVGCVGFSMTPLQILLNDLPCSNTVSFLPETVICHVGLLTF